MQICAFRSLIKHHVCKIISSSNNQSDRIGASQIYFTEFKLTEVLENFTSPAGLKTLRQRHPGCSLRRSSRYPRQTPPLNNWWQIFYDSNIKGVQVGHILSWDDFYMGGDWGKHRPASISGTVQDIDKYDR